MWTVRTYDFPYVMEGQDFGETSRHLINRIVRGMSGPRVGRWRVHKWPAANPTVPYIVVEITDGHLRRRVELHGKREARR